MDNNPARNAGGYVVTIAVDCDATPRSLSADAGHRDISVAAHAGDLANERWENWRALGAERLCALGFPDRIASTEYDEWPRGRIVYQRLAKRFVLYADRRLQRPEVIDALKRAFGLLEAEVMVMSDSHYR